MWAEPVYDDDDDDVKVAFECDDFVCSVTN